MMKKLLYALSVCLLSACGGKKSFEVSVNVPAVGTQEMTVVYLTEGGERVVERMPALDGEFEFSGVSTDTTTVEIFTAKKLLFASFPAVNGMKLKLRAEGDSLRLEGSDARVVTAYADTVAGSWPQFPELELAIMHDSVASFAPEGVWFFTSSAAERTRQLLDSIRKYAKSNSMEVRDVFIGGDMSQWRVISARDSATWTQGLLPDGPLTLRGIVNFTPCLVEVDTAGTVSRVQRLP